MSSTNGVKAADRPESKVCNVSECNAWKTGDLDFCYHHKGMASNGRVENNNHAQTHGLYTSEKTFLENAEEHHKDTYHALHESLCSRYERQHGIEPGAHDKKELSHVALEMTKIDMATEYQAENAVDPAKPLTEEQIRDIDGPMNVEAVSKVETLKNHIRRENRLLLKDKGIYKSPESQKADSLGDLASFMERRLED